MDLLKISTFLSRQTISNALVLFLFVLMLFLFSKDTQAMSGVPEPGATLQSSEAKTVPTLDGKINSSEWGDALKASKTIRMYNTKGEEVESHLLTLYIKNDRRNLYIAGQLDGEEQDGSMKGEDLKTLIMDLFGLAFDNNNDGVLQSGEDKKSLWIINKVASVKDQHQLSAAEQEQGMDESSEPQDVEGQIRHVSGNYQFELSIPLASGDVNDIQVRPGQKIRWNLLYFDKFSFGMEQLSLGGWYGSESESSQSWGYIQLFDPQSEPPPVAMASPSVMAPVSSSSVSTAGTGRDIQVWCRMNNERDLEPKTLKFIGSHYDLVLNSFPFKEKVEVLRKLNPDIKIFLFTNPYFSYGDDFWDKSPNQVKAAERKYSLKAKNDKMILYSGPKYGGMDFEQRVPLMDVSNTQWQDYFAAQTRKWVDYGGLDGVYLDTLIEGIPPWAMAPGNEYPRGFSPKKWKASNYQFLDKVINAFKGTGKKVYWNGITRAPGDHSGIPNKGMLERVDGTFIEAFSVYMAMDKNDSIKRWYFEKTVLEDLKNVSNQGKVVTMEVYGNRDDEQTRLYALTTYLLVQNARTYFYFTKMSEAGDNRWRPEWDVKLGKPLGSYQEFGSGAYTRDFEKGKVLVNPNNKAMTVQLPGNYKTWKGDRVGTSLSLPAFSGALLVKE